MHQIRYYYMGRGRTIFPKSVGPTIDLYGQANPSHHWPNFLGGPQEEAIYVLFLSLIEV